MQDKKDALYRMLYKKYIDKYKVLDNLNLKIKNLQCNLEASVSIRRPKQNQIPNSTEALSNSVTTLQVFFMSLIFRRAQVL